MEEEIKSDEPEFVPDKSVIAAYLRGLKPVRRISVSQWAESYRVLGRGVSSRPGPWSNGVTPYLVPIMDCLSVFSPYQEVVFMKGAQIAGTSAGENFIGYSIHISPGPILIMFPTLSVAKRNSKRRLAPLIADSPVLRAIVPTVKSRDGNNTILEKDFPGGNILLVGANSSSDLRSVNAQKIMMDEMDEYPDDLDGQGDPSELATKRSASYDDTKKIFKLSTPKFKGTSHIEKAFNDTDQHYCYLPCPHCAADAPVTKDTKESYFPGFIPPGYQKLVLEQFKFTPGRPEAVYYECIHCKKEIHNHHKAFMLPRYVWVPSHPEKSNRLVIGFHLNAFYSPLGMFSWRTMAADYEKALKSPGKMKTFTQTTLGLPHEEEGTQPPYEALFDRCLGSSYRHDEIPDAVSFLTCGIDIQKDRAELEVVGWGKGRRSYSICYRILLGKPEESAVWDAIEAILNANWVRKSDGLMFGINLTMIDEGYSKNEVYAFCLKMGLHRVIPVKGSDTQKNFISSPQPVFITREGKKMQALQHINISSDLYKSTLYSHLLLPRKDVLGPEYYCHFPNNYDIEHYKRLTSEKKLNSVNKQGYDKAVWTKKPGARNEQLDCRVYAMAAASVMQIETFEDADFDAMMGTLPNIAKEEEGEEQNQKKNNGGLPDLGDLPKL